jgi:NADH-quinone oxidoreductase subunit J
MCLVMSFIALAALFITLDATFIGIIQILVYAGAVMVLFLFIIMLLDLRTEESRRLNVGATVGGVLVVSGFITFLVKVVTSDPSFAQKLPPLANPQIPDVKLIGMTLFHTFWLPFEVIGALLLVATVGVIVLSKKSLR